MAFRGFFSETIVEPVGPNGELAPVKGIAATVYACNPDGSDGPQSPAYSDKSSNNQAGHLTDASGDISFYLDAGNYNIHFDDPLTPPRIKSFTKAFTAYSILSADELTTLNNYISTVGETSWKTAAVSNPANEQIFNTSYQTLSTPDSLRIDASGIRCLVGIWYRSIFTESVSGGVRAAIFIDFNQLSVPSSGGPVTQATGKIAGAPASIDTCISSYSGGLITSATAPSSYGSDVSTGQAQAIDNSGNSNLAYELNGVLDSTGTNFGSVAGGPCWIWMPNPFAPQISVQYKISSGSAFVRNRVLRVAAINMSN